MCEGEGCLKCFFCTYVDGVKEGEGVVLGLADTLGVTLGEDVQLGLTDGDGVTQAPVPSATATRATPSDSSTGLSSRLLTTCTLTLAAVCTTSNRSSREVSVPYPAGRPRGFTGDPHASPDHTDPTTAGLVPLVSDTAKVPTGAPSMRMANRSPGSQESMVSTVTSTRSMLWAPSPVYVLVATSLVPKAAKPPSTGVAPQVPASTPDHP